MVPVGLRLVVSTVLADRINHGFVSQLCDPQRTIAVGVARNLVYPGGFDDRLQIGRIFSWSIQLPAAQHDQALHAMQLSLTADKGFDRHRPADQQMGNRCFLQTDARFCCLDAAGTLSVSVVHPANGPGTLRSVSRVEKSPLVITPAEAFGI